MSASQVRWGILGAAEIARKNWRAIFHSGNGIVAGVASRDAEKARRFIADCQGEAPFDPAPRAFGCYKDLLASPEIDAVYIPLPTGLRREWVIRAAAAGKHVVCEKPCADNLDDLELMLAACRRASVQFMDGVMFMHSRRLARVREVIEDGQTIGAIKRIESAFSFCAPPEFFVGNIRSHSDLESLGCLGDLGWYCARFALWAMKERMPGAVTGRLLSQTGRKDSPAPVPTEFSGELLFEGGVSSGFYCSFLAGLQQWASISGSKGYLRLEDFVMPFRGEKSGFEAQNADFQIKGCDFSMESRPRRVEVSEHSHGHADSQEANLFRVFGEQVRSGRLNPVWPEIAWKTQAVASACLESARAGGAAITPRQRYDPR